MKQTLSQVILPIKIENSGERLTSLSGLLVVEELAQARQVWRRVDELLVGPKSGRGYAASEFVKSLVWMLHGGGRRLEDLRELEAEREVLKELGLKRVPDAGTVGDWLRRQGERGVEGLQRLNRELVRGSWGGEEEVLDHVPAGRPYRQRELERRLVDVPDVGGDVKELTRDIGDLDRVLDLEPSTLRPCSGRRENGHAAGETPAQRAPPDKRGTLEGHSAHERLFSGIFRGDPI